MRLTLINNERGATMLEYGLIAACIFLVAMMGVASTGKHAKRSVNITATELCLENDKKLYPQAYAPRPPGGAEGEAPGQHCYDRW